MQQSHEHASILRRIKRLRWYEWIVLVAMAVFLFAVLDLRLPNDNTLPIRELVPTSIKVDEANAAIEIMCLEQRLQDDGQKVRVDFALLNSSTQRQYFWGYAPDSLAQHPPLGRIHPLYAKQSRSEGRWMDDEIDRCGFGSEERRVKRGHAGRFSVYVEADDLPFRVGVYCAATPAVPWLEQNVIWSQEVTIRRHPQVASRTSSIAETLRENR